MTAGVGWIYCDAAFYVDAESGELKSKYFLVLASPERGDIVFRLLTSRYAGLRPENPPCFHGHAYAGFYLGVLGGELGVKSWVDLRRLQDFDRWDFARQEQEGRIRRIMELPLPLIRAALECAAGADDTTREQERLIRNALAEFAR